MWIASDAPRPERVRKSIGSKKVMITVAWGLRGFLVIDMLPKGTHYTKQYFIEKILKQIVSQCARCRGPKKAKGIFLHMDNAKVHCVEKELEDYGMSRLPHPPYSPDLAPSDFFLLGHLKRELEGFTFLDEKNFSKK
jgi:histone-lysine N-methyltransferase SETMAR